MEPFPKIYFIQKLQSLFHPERFQGWGKKKKYFEGWYFKVVNADATRAFAFIPGIAMDNNGQAQAFIQVLDGMKKTAVYHRFDSSLFHPARNRFHVEIENNFFNSNAIRLSLPDAHGELTFTGNTPWSKRFYSPGIMGPYTFAPFMECYHGIVSMDHSIQGSLCIKGETINMDGGRGYIEKDWGHSFPSAYIWMQSNHFSVPGISLKSSVANIPWMGSSFVGFIAGLSLHGKIIPFTTYNGTKLLKCFADQEQVDIVLRNKKYTLELHAKRDHATALASPISGMMDGRIEESMTAEIHFSLTETQTRNTIVQDYSHRAAIEVAGNVDSILLISNQLQ